MNAGSLKSAAHGEMTSEEEKTAQGNSYLRIVASLGCFSTDHSASFSLIFFFGQFPPGFFVAFHARPLAKQKTKL